MSSLQSAIYLRQHQSNLYFRKSINEGNVRIRVEPKICWKGGGVKYYGLKFLSGGLFLDVIQINYKFFGYTVV